MWLLNNETGAIKHFTLILYIFVYYHDQCTAYVPCESSIFRNSSGSFLLSDPSSFNNADFTLGNRKKSHSVRCGE